MRNLFKQTVLATAVCACMSVPAFAALGSYPMSGADHHVTASAMVSAHAMVQAKAGSAAQASVPANAAYSENVVTLDSGTVVHEFVATATNTVFAVSWKGPRLPNFNDILGTYATRYLKPTGSDVVQSRGLSGHGLQASDLVVQSYGRLGQFSGFAYLPSAIPAGVSLSELQ
jgi:hypothetical protein